MSAYRLTRQADQDLVSIARYTRVQWGEKQRRKYIQELFQLFERIATNPASGAKADFIKQGLRKRLHPKRQHAIYYRIGGDGIVEILRVLHTKQDRGRELDESTG